jgi:hypothetical protein
MLSLTRASRTSFLYHRRLLLCRVVLASMGCGLMLGGCAALCDEYTDGSVGRAARRAQTAESATFAGRKAALLRAPTKPECETQTADVHSAAVAAPSTSNADLALRIKLEYERECYRQAEARVREQLLSLQAAVAEAMKAAHGTTASAAAGGPSGSP